MPWVSAGASVLSAGIGLMGGSKAGERAAKDAAARAQYAQDANREAVNSRLAPFINNGTEASNKLAYLMGTGGYTVAKPTLEDAAAKIRTLHFQKYGKDYQRNSDFGWVSEQTKLQHERDLAEWQSGFDEWMGAQEGNSEFGSLFNKFNQQDLDTDLVYQNGLQFGLDQGTKAIESRARATGSNDSGSVLKALLKFGNDYGTTKTEGAYNRNMLEKSQKYDFLAGQSNTGLGAAGTAAGVGTNAANVSSNAQQNLGNNLSAISQANSNNQNDALQGLLSNLLYTYKSNKEGDGSSRQYDYNQVAGGGTYA